MKLSSFGEKNTHFLPVLTVTTKHITNHVNTGLLYYFKKKRAVLDQSKATVHKVQAKNILACLLVFTPLPMKLCFRANAENIWTLFILLSQTMYIKLHTVIGLKLVATSIVLQE